MHLSTNNQAAVCRYIYTNYGHYTIICIYVLTDDSLMCKRETRNKKRETREKKFQDLDGWIAKYGLSGLVPGFQWRRRCGQRGSVGRGFFLEGSGAGG